MNAIEILGLEKTYSVGFWAKRTKRALHPLHLTVEEGEIFGFLGPNGAGKTTTLKLLMGLVFPTAGSARLLGRDWTHPEVKAQIGFLPEQPYFYDHLTAHELLNYYAQLSGVPARQRPRRVEATLQRVGLKGIDGVHLRKFSKGMLQRVGIAQAILHDPKLVFFDEPMSGLDPMGRREVRDLMEELKQEGKLGRRCRCRTCPYLNHIVEQDHRAIKRRVNASQGFRSFHGARRTIQGYETMHMIRKGQVRWLPKRDVTGQVLFINEIFGVKID